MVEVHQLDEQRLPDAVLVNGILNTPESMRTSVVPDGTAVAVVPYAPRLSVVQVVRVGPLGLRPVASSSPPT